MDNGSVTLKSTDGTSVFGSSGDEDLQREHLQSLCYVLRSSARYRTGATHKMEQSKEDGKLFVEQMEAEQIDNELSWTASAAFYLQDNLQWKFIVQERMFYHYNDITFESVDNKKLFQCQRYIILNSNYNKPNKDA